jgi:hypothetical protein
MIALKKINSPVLVRLNLTKRQQDNYNQFYTYPLTISICHTGGGACNPETVNDRIYPLEKYGRYVIVSRDPYGVVFQTGGDCLSEAITKLQQSSIIQKFEYT